MAVSSAPTAEDQSLIVLTEAIASIDPSQAALVKESVSIPIMTREDSAAIIALAAKLPPKLEASVMVLTIGSAADYQQTVEALKHHRTLKAEIDAALETPKRRANAVHRGVCAIENRMLERVEPRIKAEDRALVEYDRELQRRAAEQARIAQDAIEREERARREAEAHELEVEAKRVRDKQQKVRLQQEAEAIRNAPIETPQVAIQPTTPRASGLSFVKPHYMATVTNVDAFVLDVARPKILHEFVTQLLDAKIKLPFAMAVRKSFAQVLRDIAADLPQIPSAAVGVNERFLAAQANQGLLTNGEYGPHVTVAEDENRQRTRTR